VVFDLCNVFNTDQNTVQSIYNQLNGPDIIIKMVKKTAYFLPKITYSYTRTVIMVVQRDGFKLPI